MEHLQTPLRVEPYEGRSFGDITDADDDVIAGDIDLTTARCFVKAVNCHDDLLEACQRANSCLEAHGKIDRDTTLHRIIAAAIAKAEE